MHHHQNHRRSGVIMLSTNKSDDILVTFVFFCKTKIHMLYDDVLALTANIYNINADLASNTYTLYTWYYCCCVLPPPPLIKPQYYHKRISFRNSLSFKTFGAGLQLFSLLMGESAITIDLHMSIDH